jgi:ectoine hydroxylase-related dioxygenase (phytanoyl-CoA dioxygenase family)
MKNSVTPQKRFHNDQDISINQFRTLCEQQTDKADYPLASSIEKQVPIYSSATLKQAIAENNQLPLQSEMARVLDTGPGVLVIKQAFEDIPIVDQMSSVFQQLLTAQSHLGGADHFAAAGSNGRVWNVFEKSASVNPLAFIHYYKNPLLQLISQAWLGPHYQITAQLNVVYPGGRAQQPHRDYHLGFQENQEISRYPTHVHNMSRYLTLQGGVAHSDMPIESGPTQLLPFSQQYELGYLSWRDPDFIAYFKAHRIQLPLEKGDALFFNPALFHAAGDNNSKSIKRSVNLLQISSPFAKPMETVDSYKISELVYPHIARLLNQKALSSEQLEALINACCDGYSFPSNLDTDPPAGSMAPQTAAQLTQLALTEKWTDQQYLAQLAQHKKRRLSE